MKSKKILVSVTNDLVTDQRVDKVCRYLQQHGASVVLVGRKRKQSLKMDDRPYQTHRIRLLFEQGALFYAFFNFRLFFFLLFSKADIYVANDLDTLLANRMAAKIRRKPLVYDSHEYFTEVPELVNRRFVQSVWERIEKSIFPKLAYIITVNDSIAGLYEKKYGKKIFVVRNIPSPKNIVKQKSRTDLGLPEDKHMLIIQGAGINIHRGNEEMLEAMQWIENSVLVILGDGDVLPQLKKFASENNLQDKVFFVGKKPYQEMIQYTLNADIGITMDKSNNINYKFSLPNKLFDFIHAGIAVFSSDLPEVGAIVSKYNTGIICDSHEPRIIAQKINELLANPELLQQFKNNAIKAKTALTWEKECKVLDQIYLPLLV